MKSLLDPTFKYVPSTSTNIRRTFARARKQIALQRAAVEAPAECGLHEAINDMPDAHSRSIRLSEAGNLH